MKIIGLLKFARLIILFLFLLTINLNAQQSNCVSNYFLKKYSSADSIIRPLDMVLSGSNGVIIGGYIFVSSSGNILGLVAKIDENGNKLWELHFAHEIQRVLALRDGSFIALGLTNVTKFNASGGVLWSKELSDIATDIQEGPDGSLYFVARGYYLDQRGLKYFKTDSNCNPIYTKIVLFTGGSVLTRSFFKYFILKDGYMYLVGEKDSDNSYGLKGFLCKVEMATGRLIWTKNYSFLSEEMIIENVFEYPGNKICLFAKNTINSSDLNVAFVCDTSGTVLSSSSIQFGYERQFGCSGIDVDGNIIFGNYYGSYVPSSDLGIVKFNPLTGSVWSKNYPTVIHWPQVISVEVSSSGQFYLLGVGQTNVYSGYLFLIKSNSIGDFGCSSQNMPVTIAQYQISTADWQWAEYDQNLTTASTVPSPNLETEINNGSSECMISETCNSIAILHSDTICAINQLYNVRVTTNQNCSALPNFIFNSAAVQLISYQNNIASFNILAPGPTRIIVELFLSCGTIRDSLELLVKPTPPIPSLGQDFTFCQSIDSTLHVASGYISYLWQDGSTDSTFRVRSSGIYHVTVTDFCGSVFTDTITITQVSNNTIDIGADRRICPGDTTLISAPGGYSNYSWSPNYNLINISANSIRVFPSRDTFYFVSAIDLNGCRVQDSIRISRYVVQPISLGRDTSICMGDSLLLNPGIGYVNFIWSTGSTSFQIYASQIGSYWVQAHSSDLCLVSDTIVVENIWQKPIVNLGVDGHLCENENRLLQPGNFVSYLWQDGSVNPTLNVSNPGLYFVKVFNAQGCTTTDSLFITEIIPLPKNFLPRDTSICIYGKLELKPNKYFKNYLWNTNATTASIEINSPGLYWLKVADGYGCSGVDSILIFEKECLKGFFMPTGFTPNNDGLNDVICPIIGGRIANYHFLIYNRWGQAVYDSRVLNAGWDGIFHGVRQDSGMFVWVCEYELEGLEPKVEKGTFLLIR